MRGSAPLILTFKPFRFEWGALVGATVLASAGALIVASLLASMTPPPACLPITWGGQIEADAFAACPIGAFLDLRDAAADRLAAILPWLSVIGGAVIGAQVVAREVEGRTTQFIWALEPTRRRWFAERVGTAMVGLAISAAIASICGAILAHARFPGLDIGSYIPIYGQFGLGVVFRATAAMSIAILLGALIGRIVPALLLSLLLAAVIAVFVPVAALRTAPGYVVDAGSPTSPTELTIESGWADAQGRIISEEQARALAPTPGDPVTAQQWVAEHFRAVSIRIDGRSLQQVALSEALGLVALTALGIGLSYASVRIRRVS